MYPANDYYIIRDGASSHISKLCQNFLQATLHRTFINENKCPPKSPDLNILDFYCWNALQECACDNVKEPFHVTDQLKTRIMRVWPRTVAMVAEILWMIIIMVAENRFYFSVKKFIHCYNDNL